MKLTRLVGLLLALFLLSCAASTTSPSRQFTATEGQALLTAYLTTSGSSLASMSFTLSDVAVFSGGVWVDLALPPQRIERRTNQGQQHLLGTSLAPLGDLRRIRLRLTDIKIDGKGLVEMPGEDLKEIVLSAPAALEENDSQCLFLDWNLDGHALLPIFSAWGQQPVLGAGLAYVLCDDISTIYVVRTDTNDIVSAFSLPGPLGEIRLNPRSRRLYVLSAGKRALYVYDCVKSRLLEQIDLPRTIAPRSLALAVGENLAFVTDSASSQVLKIDLQGGVVTAHQQLSLHPEKLVYSSADNGTLAVLAPAAQKVFLLSSRSLKVLRTLTVGLSPDAVIFFDGALYVSEQSTDKVSIYESQTGRFLNSIPVGRAPADLLKIDENQLLVSNSGGTSLSVLFAGQKTSFLRIPTLSGPTDMELSKRKKQLYVASHEKKHLSVIEVTGRTMRKQLFLGGTPLSIAVLD